MSLNVQIEPFEESSSIVDLSSNEAEHPETTETHCSICLGQLTNKCHSNSCWHLFCFDCLKRWSEIQPSCPLCKYSFETIRHSLNTGMGVKYEVSIRERELSPRLFNDISNDIPDVNSSRMFRMTVFLYMIRSNERPMNNINTTSLSNLNDHDHNHNSNLHPYAQFFNYTPSSFDPYGGRGSTIRIQVFTDNLRAEPLLDLFSQFRDCTLTFFSNDPLLHEFIARDITATRSLQRPEDINQLTEFSIYVELITHLVIQAVVLYDIRDPIMTDLLQNFVGDHAAHFCHELYNFVNSPYNIIAYDSYVRYSNRQGYSPFYQQPGFDATNIFDQVPTALPIPGIFNHSQTIIQDSDDEIIETGTRRFTQEIIVISSSSEDSDVEITGHSFCPIEVLDSSSRDQPSTLTGIRDSLDRPNNRFISPIESPYSPNLKREKIILDPSLSDESITSYRDSQGKKANTKRQKQTLMILDQKSFVHESDHILDPRPPSVVQTPAQTTIIAGLFKPSS